MAEEIQHTEEIPETPSNVEATETPTPNEESETKVNTESEETPLQSAEAEASSGKKQDEDTKREKSKFRNWIDRHTDPKQVGSFVVALFASVLAGLAVNYMFVEGRHWIYNRRPYITFESDFTQVFHISDSVQNLEYSVGEKRWKKLGTQNVVFGGNRGTLKLRSRNNNGTEDATISFATDAQVICTGDIRTLVDYKHYKQANMDEAVFSRLFLRCTQLVVAPELPATKLANDCYSRMFLGCTSLKTAPELPATELAEDCYSAMFSGCTSLKTAPELPAMELAAGCYSLMFDGCTSLKTAPELPAMDLATDCYIGMFFGCTSLERAPDLPALELALTCYCSMFRGCTSLKKTPLLPAEELAPGCYRSMFEGCTSLTMAPKLPAMNLAESCYDAMFKECTSLKYVSILPATELVSNCYFDMFSGCTSLSEILMMAIDTMVEPIEYHSIIYHENPSPIYHWLDNTSPTGTFGKNKNATWNNTDIVPPGWNVVLVDPEWYIYPE